MKNKLLKVLSLLMTFFNLCLYSQNEASQWYFGQNAGLNFLTNPPSILLNSNLNTSEGCTSISDAAGNFLFSSDGDTLLNQAQIGMTNSGGLLGNVSSSQSSIVVKRPGSNSVYYLFTNASNIPNSGFRYSIIDMSLAAGIGSVTAKNIPLYSHIISEKLSATRHCNGTDIWVMVHDSLNNFRAYLVTAAGVNTTAVISSIGTIYYPLNVGAGVGCMKFSANGKKLGAALSSTSGSFSGKIELYDFDNSSGVLSNLQTFIMASSVYDCEFSPDGTKLYTAATSTLGTQLLQWNLCAGSASAIALSEYTVFTSSNLIRAFQRAINGKIYVARAGFTFLGVINNPNLIGSVCNFVMNGLSIAPDTCTAGLPNFVNSLIKSTLNYSQDLSCTSLSFSPPATVYTGTMGCSNVVNTVNGYQWNFGDPSSGAANTSLLSNPVHSFSSYGTYSVQLVLTYNNCAPDTFKQNIIVTNPNISINSTSVSCDGLANATISISQGYSNSQYTYTWMPGTLFGSIQNNLSSGVYTILANAIGGTCVSTITAYISPSSTVNAIINTTLSCSTASAQVIINGGSGNYTYSWSPVGGTSSVTHSLNPGFYTVTISDITNSCSLSQTLQINTLEVPILSITGNYSICAGNSATIIASGANTYSWNTSTLGPVIVVSPSLSTIYNVIGTSSVSQCSSTKTVSLIVSKCLGINEINGGQNVKLYPNPNTGILQIDIEAGLSISIQNLIGEVLYEKFYERGHYAINISHLANGVYFIKARYKDQNQTFKILKTEELK